MSAVRRIAHSARRALVIASVAAAPAALAFDVTVAPPPAVSTNGAFNASGVWVPTANSTLAYADLVAQR